MVYHPSTSTGPRPWIHPRPAPRRDPDLVEREAVEQGKTNRALRDHLVNDLHVDRERVKATANEDLPALVYDVTTEHLIRVTLTGVAGDHGSIVLFDGVGFDDNDTWYTIAVDHRCARDIHEAINAGEDVNVDVEPWQVFRSGRSS